jgi:hypothetical protein
MMAGVDADAQCVKNDLNKTKLLYTHQYITIILNIKHYHIIC